MLTAGKRTIHQDGFIDLPDRPGFGVTLKRDKLKRPYTREGKHLCCSYARSTLWSTTETLVVLCLH